MPRNNKIKIISLSIVIVLLFSFIINYYNSNSSFLIQSNKKINNDSILSMMLETNTTGVYEKSNSSAWPTSGYTFNETLSGCENGGNLKWENNKLVLESTNTDKCYAYFDKVNVITVDYIVRDAKPGTIIVNSVCDNENCSGIFYISDGMYGNMTYYYRGVINNNWVKFGKENGKDIYWRILRFNGDGSVRMIYSGTTAPTEEEQYVMTGEKTQIGTSTFNQVRGDSVYVGWKWTLGDGHGTDNDSTVRNYILNNTTGWYYTSGLSNYSDYIADGNFCNDRAVDGPYGSNWTGSQGYGTEPTVFAPRRRSSPINIESWSTNQIISTGCSNSRDIFLEKVGIITYDEALLAGGKAASNNLLYYLYTGSFYYTMSPDTTNAGKSGGAGIFRINSNGNVHVYYVNASNGVRPVINLKSGTTFTGDGTWNNPYQVVETNE